MLILSKAAIRAHDNKEEWGKTLLTALNTRM